MTHPLFDTFMAGIEEIIPETSIDTIRESKQSLTVKWGADPSAPDLHLGHMVVLNKLRLLQEMGHQIIFLIGNFTAMIGDPTGKSQTRKPLSEEDVARNAQTYQDQVFRILDREKTIVRFNGEWLNQMTAQQIVKLAAQYNVARMLERDDFNKRYTNNQSISVHEFLYPLFQGYDSVALDCDVEFGGTDQKFNLLVGRHLQKEYRQRQQTIITTPILEGLDGVQKMSKSLNNHIGILDEPNEMFGKLMSIPDELITRYFTLLTDVPATQIKQLEDEMASGSLNPKIVKEKLGLTMVTRLHSEEAAQAAQAHFHQVFAKKEVPDEMPDLVISDLESPLGTILIDQKILPSKKEFTRLVQQGAITLDGEAISDIFFKITEAQNGSVLKIGKRRFYKIVA